MRNGTLDRAERFMASLEARAALLASTDDDLAEMIEADCAAKAAEIAEIGAATAFQGSAHTADIAEIDALATPPKATDVMFYGPLGDLAKQAADGTEVNPVSAMAAAMVWLSATMGRNTYIAVGDESHHLRLYGLHVGRSSRGGKGMSLGLLNRVRKAIEERHAGLCGNYHGGGLSSREGLAFLIHDGYREGKEDVPPIADKRLFIVETEFSNVLAQTKRDGNTLSAVLRDAWDGASIKPATKSSRLWATRPHVALHGCITPSELRSKLSNNELINGFANRFLIFWAERIGETPFPKRASDEVVDDFANKFSEIIKFGLAGYPDAQKPRGLTLSEQARGLYADLYRDYRQPHPAGELVTSLLERRAPMLLRMAGLFAVTGLKTEITREHVAAAAAWMDYYTQSVAFIFGPMTDAVGEVEKNADAEKLAAFLIERGDWVSRTDITNACFKKRGGKRVDAAIEALALENRIERRETGDGPRKRTEYRFQSPPRPQSHRGSDTRVVAECPQYPQYPHAEIESADSGANASPDEVSV